MQLIMDKGFSRVAVHAGGDGSLGGGAALVGYLLVKDHLLADPKVRGPEGCGRSAATQGQRLRREGTLRHPSRPRATRLIPLFPGNLSFWRATFDRPPSPRAR